MGFLTMGGSSTSSLAAGIRHTRVSPNTLGRESISAVTFPKKGASTLMTLVHSELPNTKEARSHEKGWNYFLDLLLKQFGPDD